MSENTPPGLDEFLASPASQTEASPMAPKSGEPAGLDAFIAPEVQEEKYGSLGQQAITAAESAGKGLAGPVAPLLEEAAGVNPEDIRARAEENPATAFAGEAAGFVAPALASFGSSAAAKVGLTGLAKAIPTISKFTQLGALEKISAKLAPIAGETLASKIGSAAAKGAIENMLLTGSDEVSRMILHDPEQSVQSAVADLGLSAVLGGALGGGLKGAGHLWDATVGSKAAQLAADFKGRINEHIHNPDPVAAMGEELATLHKNVTGLADEVYGASGLKAKDIEASVPHMHEGIVGQINEVSDKVQKTLDKLSKDDHAGLLEDVFTKYKEAVTTDEPAKIFNATQELKQQLQEWGRFNKDIVPLKERPFRNAAKDLAANLKTSLEDTKIWGKAAERQSSINKAFTEYLPALRDFESTFMNKVGEEKVINPGKINTYLNQLGKANAEIKQAKLQNFIDASKKYQKVISDTHMNLGMDAPEIHSPLNVTMSSLEEKTLGSKLADMFIQKGLTDVGSEALGATIGGSIGHAAGIHSGVGALLGAKALGPFFKSILPALAKGFMDKPAASMGVKAAIDHTAAVAKGNELINKATKNIFKLGVAVLPEHAKPTDKDREKLNKNLRSIQGNPEPMFTKDDKLAHYMPQQSSAQDQMFGSVINYLNGIRTDLDRKSPLDSKPVPSSTQKAAFNNALDIAQQPLIVLDKIKNGTLTAKDIEHIGSMYPQLYNGLKTKLMEQITETVKKQEVIPYRTRIGLSMFLAEPLDSTMNPMSIMAAQTIPKQNQPQQAQQPKKGTKSSPALQKMPKSYQTSNQSVETRQQRDK